MKTSAQIVLILGLLVGFAGLVAAQSPDNLTMHLSMQQSNPVGEVRDACWIKDKCDQFGWVNSPWWMIRDNKPYPVWGDAKFDLMAPTWTDSYGSGSPTQWLGQCYMMQCTYQAIYPEGGSITVNGPNGLVFNGVLTDGTYNASWGYSIDGRTNSGNETATFNFTGTWNNGINGYGTVYNYYSFIQHHGPDGSSGGYSNIAKLDMYQTN
jgi:hypothetical protein